MLQAGLYGEDECGTEDWDTCSSFPPCESEDLVVKASHSRTGLLLQKAMVKQQVLTSNSHRVKRFLCRKPAVHLTCWLLPAVTPALYHSLLRYSPFGFSHLFPLS